MADFADDPVAWILQHQRDTLKEVHVLQKMQDRIWCAQGGEYPKTFSPPLIILGPGDCGEDITDRKPVQLDYEYIDIEIHCYTQHVGHEKGLFGDTALIGLTAMWRAVYIALRAQRWEQQAIKRIDWLGTTHPGRNDRINLNSNEAVVRFRYHLALEQ